MYDLIIIGAGPAGLSAGLFAGLYGLKTLVLGEKLGGQATIAPLIIDYPGVQAIRGKDWVEVIVKQINEAGVEVIQDRVLSIMYQVLGIKERKEGAFVVNTVNQEYSGLAVVLATGNQRRRPDYSGVELARALGVTLQARNGTFTGIVVDEQLSTNIAGVFAAGDCLCYPVSLEQISVASSLGIRAAASAYTFIKGLNPPIMWGKAKIARW